MLDDKQQREIDEMLEMLEAIQDDVNSLLLSENEASQVNEVEGDVNSLSLQEKVSSLIDVLDEELDALILEESAKLKPVSDEPVSVVTTVTEPVAEEIDVKHPPLNGILQKLIQEFKRTDAAQLKEQCQKLVGTYGFSQFEKEFDTILSSGEFSSRKERRALKLINQYVTDTKVTSYAVFVAQNAQQMLDLLKIPDEQELREKASEAAIRDNYQEAKKIAIEAVTAKREARIKEIGDSSQITQMKLSAVQHAKAEADQEISVINARQEMPLDYYVEKEYRQEFVKQQPMLEVGKFDDMLHNHIANDVLSRDTVLQKAIAVERYILIAERMMSTRNRDAASKIFAGLEPIVGVNSIKSSLSERAQTQWKEMMRFLNPRNPDLAVSNHGSNDRVPVTLMVTNLVSALWKKPVLQSSIIDLSEFHALRQNCENIVKASPPVSSSNAELLQELSHPEEPMEERMSALRKETAKPVAPEVSRVLYSGYNQKGRERGLSLIQEMESKVEQIRTKWDGIKKLISGFEEKIEGINNKFKSFFKFMGHILNHAKESTQEDKAQFTSEMLKHATPAELIERRDAVIDDLMAYNIKKGGGEDYVARVQIPKKGTEVIIPKGEEKKYYSAVVIKCLQKTLNNTLTSEDKSLLSELSMRLHSVGATETNKYNNTLLKKINEDVVPLLKAMSLRSEEMFSYTEQNQSLKARYQEITGKNNEGDTLTPPSPCR